MKVSMSKFPENKPGLHFASTAALKYSAKPIGSGALSYVYRAQDPYSNKQFAVKVIDLKKLTPPDQENVFREIATYSALNHPSVIKLYDYIIEKGVIYIILEFAEGGDLHGYIQKSHPLSERTILRIFHQVLEVVGHIHSKQILVRDIKPANILLSQDNNIKLCDFGWACRLDDFDSRQKRCGTLNYMSPEALRGLMQDAKSDVWSLGVLLFELYFSRAPFQGNNELEMLRIINVGLPKRFFEEKRGAVSPEAADLIKSMLHPVAAKRPTISQIRNHAFFDRLSRESDVNPFSEKEDSKYSIDVPKYQSHGKLTRQSSSPLIPPAMFKNVGTSQEILRRPVFKPNVSEMRVNGSKVNIRPEYGGLNHASNAKRQPVTVRCSPFSFL